MERGIVREALKVEMQPVERGEKAFIQVLIGPEDGVPHFIIRKFTILPGGGIPRHLHPTIEHEQYILSGRMKLGLNDGVKEVVAGQAIFIPSSTLHWYKNESNEPVEFLCVIPRTSGYATDWVEEKV